MHQPQINYHLESKEALWTAAVDLFGLLAEALDGVIPAELTGADAPQLGTAFADGIRRFVGFAAEYPELNQIMVHEGAAASDRLAWMTRSTTRSCTTSSGSTLMHWWPSSRRDWRPGPTEQRPGRFRVSAQIAAVSRWLPAAGVAEIHQLPDGVVFVGLGQLTAAVPGYLDLAAEPQVCAIEMREPGGDALNALDRIGHSRRRQVTGAGERHHIPVLAVVVGVAGDRRDGLAGLRTSA